MALNDKIIRLYSEMVEDGDAKVVGVVNVWSNGKTIRRYQGQGAGFNRSPEKGYRRMTAISVEEVAE